MGILSTHKWIGKAFAGSVLGLLFLGLGLQGIYSVKKQLELTEDQVEKSRLKKKLEANWHLFWGGSVIIIAATYYLLTN